MYLTIRYENILSLVADGNSLFGKFWSGGAFLLRPLSNKAMKTFILKTPLGYAEQRANTSEGAMLMAARLHKCDLSDVKLVPVALYVLRGVTTLQPVRVSTNQYGTSRKYADGSRLFTGDRVQRAFYKAKCIAEKVLGEE